MCKDLAGCALTIINVLFLLVSAALIIVGALLQWGGPAVQSQIIPGLVKIAGNSTLSMSDFKAILNQYVAVLGNAGLILFIIGIILFAICLCGTCGVCCKNRLLMILYLIFTLIIWVLIVIFIIVFFTKRESMRTSAGNEYLSFLKNGYIFNNGTYVTATSGLEPTGIIDLIQARASCCGSYNSSDFQANKGYNTSFGIIPYSCCKMIGASFTPMDSNCIKSPTLTNSYMTTGCYNLLWEIIEKYSNYAAYALIGLGILLLILIIIAGVLTKSYRDKD